MMCTCLLWLASSIVFAAVAQTFTTSSAQGVCPNSGIPTFQGRITEVNAITHKASDYAFTINVDILVRDPPTGYSNCSGPGFLAKYALEGTCITYSDEIESFPQPISNGCLYTFVDQSDSNHNYFIHVYCDPSATSSLQIDGNEMQLSWGSDGDAISSFNARHAAVCSAPTSHPTETTALTTNATTTSADVSTGDLPSSSLPSTSITETAIPSTPTGPSTTTVVAYTNVTFVSSTSSDTWLPYYIRQYLNLTTVSAADVTDTIAASCNATRNDDGNYTCIVTFSNYSQAVDATYGANHGYITNVFSAEIIAYGTTTENPAENSNDNNSKAPVVVGAIIGVVAAGVIAAIAVVILRRRARMPHDESTHLNSVFDSDVRSVGGRY